MKKRGRKVCIVHVTIAADTDAAGRVGVGFGCGGGRGGNLLGGGVRAG